jgi:MFS family permease
VANTFERNTPVATSVATSIGVTRMCVGKSMAILDVQVMATSLPTIQSALDIPSDQMSWVQTAYLIAEVVAAMSHHHVRCRSLCVVLGLLLSVLLLEKHFSNSGDP